MLRPKILYPFPQCAGKSFRPSNGTEGMIFEEHFCSQSQENLQVHHKKYINGKMAWEYSWSDLITLCNACHKKEHGMDPEGNQLNDPFYRLPRDVAALKGLDAQIRAREARERLEKKDGTNG